MSNEEKKEKNTKEETPKLGHCCGTFSQTEEFLRKALGELPTERIQEVNEVSCDCGCEGHSHTDQAEIIHDPKEVKDYVKKRYASLITQPGSSCCEPSIAAPIDTKVFEIATKDKQKFAEEIGYTEIDLKGLPEDVTDISFGCGNPTAIANLKSGEVVLDLGSGGGIDVFLAAKKVGPTGKAIGLDMTPEMIQRANANAEKVGVSNVEFKLGEMENIPLLDNSVDVVISNCVINLSPDKAKVFRQIFRVLKPGGRIAISDIVLNGQLPELIQKSFEAWAGCVAGALQEEDYLQKIRDAGLINIEIESKRTAKELSYFIKESPELSRFIQEQAGCTPEELLDRIVSIKVKANKPN